MTLSLQWSRLPAIPDHEGFAAPFAGVVAKRYADPGTMAGPGAPLLLVEGGSLRLEASAPESVLKRLKLGQTLPVTLVGRA